VAVSEIRSGESALWLEFGFHSRSERRMCLKHLIEPIVMRLFTVLTLGSGNLYDLVRSVTGH
jgi:hypothetical protein